MVQKHSKLKIDVFCLSLYNFILFLFPEMISTPGVGESVTAAPLYLSHGLRLIAPRVLGARSRPTPLRIIYGPLSCLKTLHTWRMHAPAAMKCARPSYAPGDGDIYAISHDGGTSGIGDGLFSHGAVAHEVLQVGSAEEGGCSVYFKVHWRNGAKLRADVRIMK